MAEKKESEYSKKLRDPRWQRMRLEILNRDNWTCQKCGATEATLHVHHLYYHHGRDPWDYVPNALAAVCEDCHTEEYLERHKEEQTLLQALRACGFWHDDLCDLYSSVAIGDLPLSQDKIHAFCWAIRTPSVMDKILAAYHEKFPRTKP